MRSAQSKSSSEDESVWVIIPAAGVGSRMNSNIPKQYLKVHGKTILEHTVSRFSSLPSLAGILIVVSETDLYWDSLASNFLKQSQSKGIPLLSTFGGSERSDTVLKGLSYLLNEEKLDSSQWVMVHDAARPLLSATALERIVTNSHPQGAILAIPARDTVKRQTDSGRVQGTLDRNHIWLAQTPQKFPADALYGALQKANQQGVEITDECSAMEFIGWHPYLVVGESSNIKVTLPEDLLIADALFSQLH